MPNEWPSLPLPAAGRNMNAAVMALPPRPKVPPRQRLMDALHAAYRTMTDADREECADVYLAMIDEGVRASRERPE